MSTWESDLDLSWHGGTSELLPCCFISMQQSIAALATFDSIKQDMRTNIIWRIIPMYQQVK